jgi:ribosomal 50S subunit-associated protein YjgA (DUF615 family)
MAFQEAMQKAKELEKKGMYRRAWRVRLNLDGEQPVYAPARPDTEPPPELTEKEKKELRRKKKRLNELRLKADKLAEELEYIPLPESVHTAVRAAWRQSFGA